MRLDLFGTTYEDVGKRIWGTNQVQGTRRSLSRASIHMLGSYKLGQWVMDQRIAQILCLLRKKRLNAIGFIWDAKEHAWEQGFAALIKFKAREGHCRVPQSHIEGKYRLGQWVQIQRAKGCLLNAGSVSMRLDLSGTRSNMLGNKDLRH